MRNFKDLHVWQKAIKLVTLIYETTKTFPDDERFGLVIQMRRSALSIPSNIAEGHMRTTNKDFKQFLAIARGSCAELETQTVISLELGYLTTDIHDQLIKHIQEVAKMLSSLYSKL